MAKEHRATQSGEIPAAVAKTPMISSVILKDHLMRYEYAPTNSTQDPLATPDITANAAEHRADQETDILLVRW